MRFEPCTPLWRRGSSRSLTFGDSVTLTGFSRAFSSLRRAASARAAGVDSAAAGASSPAGAAASTAARASASRLAASAAWRSASSRARRSSASRRRRSSSARCASDSRSSASACSRSASTGCSAASVGRFTRVRFWRTSMLTTLPLAAPLETVSSPTFLRRSVICRGASASAGASSRLPCWRRRKPSSLTFSVLVTTSSALAFAMPAWAICSSSFSAVRPSACASCFTELSDIAISLRVCRPRR